MSPSVDDKKYSTDTRSMRDAFIQDFPQRFKKFDESPISSACQISDICVYKPGDLNKLGKEGKTSWDSFSYALQMSHNVWTHIHAVQEANRKFDQGSWPAMMRHSRGQFEFFVDIVERIFTAPTKKAALEIIDRKEYASKTGYWAEIIGGRGFVGKRAVNANTNYNKFFKETQNA